MENYEGRIEKLIDLLVLKVPEIIAGLLILIIGRYVISLILKIVKSRFEKRNIDISIRGFILSLLKFVCYTLLILTVASTVGIQTTSFIAVLSAFGLAVGLALQGSLSNFAGGVLILLFRPFEIGDYIDSENGASGTVEKIDLLYTILRDANGISVFSPNGTLANSVIKNYTKITSRRFEIVIRIGYDDNIKVAREAILQILHAEKSILKKPAPIVFVGSLGDSSVNLTVRGWISRDEYWDIYNHLQEKIKMALDERGITIPYPQTEMHIKNLPKDIAG
ncbi:mechanosensitive ion channel family protein [Sphingobacterium sp. T2]|uniref:mechanosensitive ion channel family protein n=1 Tax=Sphingobacterium sp. T2 TaxID=1590596 RepID=UPI00057B8EE7|nr:mechanosensitive ion channel domain-containing protein [Sphingobacterium sp. T2]